MYKKVILKAGKERSVLNYHPWLFSGAIAKHQAVDSEIVEVFDAQNNYLATGHFSASSIAVRIITFEKQIIDDNFWVKKIQQAYNTRAILGLTDNAATNAYRLVHAEGDGLPGLIIDIYAQAAVIQCHSKGMYTHLQQIAHALQNVYGKKLQTIYNKSAETLHQNNVSENGFLLGNAASGVITENHIPFEVNWAEGQKTGFFIDQRYNRQLLTHYCKNKSVLNTFAYSGGFSFYAMQAGASVVHSVDSSKKAAATYANNLLLHKTIPTQQYITSDVMDFIKVNEEAYDIIILDPPAFAKHHDAIKKAAIAYRNLNAEAFKQIKPNGILFTFSCSQAIDKTLFRKIIFAAAAMSKRHIKILHQ
ncbi:MAG TPA: class I SAM-dependent rRNA methyltransferase, partial [Bacteroidia bacterium]|nr:class I SAM-dependent rRNA methyltransferase [Bacteroidia bacterium]